MRLAGLSVIAGLLSLQLQQAHAAEIQASADVVVYKKGGKAYAQVAATDLGLERGKIIASGEEGLNDSDVIQKAIDLIHQSYKGKRVGKTLFRTGRYNLGRKGIEFFYEQPSFIEGEGRGRTVFEYRGTANAFGYKKVGSVLGASASVFQAEGLTLRIGGDANCGIWMPTMNHILMENIEVIASKGSKPKVGIFVDGGGGNLKGLKNISIRGPFEVGFKARVDWIYVFNLEVKGFRKHGVVPGGPAAYWGVRVSTAEKGARAGVFSGGRGIEGAGAGLVYAYARTIYFKSTHQLDAYASQYAYPVLFHVVDETPPLEGYTPFLGNSRLHIGDYSVHPSYEEEGFGEVVAVKRAGFPPFIPGFDDLKRRLSERSGDADLIVFKHGGKAQTQVASKRLAGGLGVEVGHMLISGSDQDAIQEAVDALPIRGKLVIRSGGYGLESLRIPWDKELTVKGEGCYHGTRLNVRNGISFKNVRSGKLARFWMSDLEIRGGPYAVKLEQTSAVLENLLTPYGKTGIVVESGDGNILRCVDTAHGHQVDISAKAPGTLIFGPQFWSRKVWGAELGPQGVFFGGHAGHVTTYAPEAKNVDEAWRANNGAVVMGMADEWGALPTLLADKSNLYIFGCNTTHWGCREKSTGEKDGGRVVLVQ